MLSQGPLLTLSTAEPVMCVCIELLQTLEKEKTDAENAERRKEEEARLREADEAEAKADKLKKAGS